MINYHAFFKGPGLLWPMSRKFLLLILLTPFLMSSVAGFSQKLSIKQENISYQQLFLQIKKQTGYNFLYDLADFKSFGTFNVDMKNVTVEEMLLQSFRGTPLTFRILKGNVVIKRRIADKALPPVEIKGKVTDEKGVGVQGVSVRVKGGTASTVTNTEGEYTIIAPAQDALLVFSFVGFRQEEMALNGRKVVHVVLKEQNQGLDQVVVIGYGTQKRSDITGAVSSVDMKQLTGTPLRSVDQALQGRVAGVFFVQNSGMPGAGSSMRIRGGNSINGSNEPLYVVDGVPVLVNGSSDGFSLNPLNNISPADIQSIEVLKDASATAIYGSRGGNGVVLVTTKRGNKNRAIITADVYRGFQDELKRYDLLSAKEFETLANDASIAEGGSYIYDPALNPVTTDWQDQLFRAEAPIQSYQLSASGGNEKNQYLASFNYFDQQGIIKSSDMERFSVRFNGDHQLSEKVKFGSGLTFSNVVTNKVNSASLFSMLTTPPNLPIYQSDGSYTQFNLQGIGFNNPVALLNGYVNKNQTFRGLGNAYVSADLVKGLTVKTMWAMDAIFSKNDSYIPQSVYSGSLVGGSADVSTGRNLTWLNENTLTYQKTFGIHKIDALVGYTQQSSRVETLNASASGFLNDNTGSNNLGLGSQAQAELPGSSTSGWSLQSWIGRLNYSLQSKYLLTLTSRYDGSSRFGRNNRWGFFPSAAVAWRAIEEDFIKDLNVFSDFKVRGSHGITGNQEGIGNYPAMDLWGASNYVFDDHIVNGLAPTQVINNNLKWESTRQSDIGLEIGFFKNRLSFVVDAYYKHTNDLLLAVTVPASSGFVSGTKNIGSLENKGIEFTITGVPFDGAFKWNTSFNISFNKNKVLNLGVEDEIIPSGLSTTLLKVGQPVGNFLGYITDGIFQSQEEVLVSSQQSAKPGDLRFIDFDGNGIINASDRRVMGNAQPIFYGGLNNSFSYQQFELSFFFQYVYGNEVYNLNTGTLLNLRGLQNQTTDALNRWSPDHKDTNVPRASSTRSDGEANDTFVEDGTYLRLKNLQLAYNLPSRLLNKIGVKSAKIYTNAQNVLTFSNYSGLDPEVSRYASDNVRQGYDSGSYPSARTLTLGLTVGF